MIQGQLDIPLNETGEEQAKEAGKKFKTINFDLAFSSDLLRAKRTAELIVLEKKLAVETTKLLRERHYGTLQGKSSSVLADYWKILNKLSHNERLHYKIDDEIESDDEVISRVFTFLRETALANPGKTILIATHGGVLMKVLIHLGMFTYEQTQKIRILNAGYLKLESDGVEFFIKETGGIENREADEL